MFFTKPMKMRTSLYSSRLEGRFTFLTVSIRNDRSLGFKQQIVRSETFYKEILTLHTGYFSMFFSYPVSCFPQSSNFDISRGIRRLPPRKIWPKSLCPNESAAFRLVDGWRCARKTQLLFSRSHRSKGTHLSFLLTLGSKDGHDVAVPTLRCCTNNKNTRSLINRVVF